MFAAACSQPAEETSSTTTTGATASETKTAPETGTATTGETASSTGTTGETTTTTPPTETAPTGDEPLTGSKILVKLGNGKSFTLQLDAKNAPESSKGIEALVKERFYDGTRVHRVEPGFCVQWGDPLSKNGVDAPGVGTGGSGKTLPFEPGKLSFKTGVLGVASKGAGTGGDGQLFVMTGDATQLDGNYAAIGKVVEGLDVATAIQRGEKIASMSVVK